MAEQRERERLRLYWRSAAVRRELAAKQRARGCIGGARLYGESGRRNRERAAVLAERGCTERAGGETESARLYWRSAAARRERAAKLRERHVYKALHNATAPQSRADIPMVRT